MANIQINWTPYNPDPGDVDEVVVLRSTTVTNGADFEAKLNANDFTGIDTLTSANEISGADITSVSSYTNLDVPAGDYYYCLAAKNSGGYNVGAGAASSISPTSGTPVGGVAFVSVS